MMDTYVVEVGEESRGKPEKEMKVQIALYMKRTQP